MGISRIAGMRLTETAMSQYGFRKKLNDSGPQGFAIDTEIMNTTRSDDIKGDAYQITTDGEF
jgi:hypothetical protein